MPANETYRDPYFVAIAEPGAKLARDISSMGIASTDGAAAREQQEKIKIARQRQKDHNARIASLESQIVSCADTINTLGQEQTEIKELLVKILTKMEGSK